MSNDLKIIDKTKDAKWLVHLGAFRLVHPIREDKLIMEPGIKYKLVHDEWLKGQPTVKVTDEDEEVEAQQPQVTQSTGLPGGDELKK